jgi:hypothetical protein
VPQLFELDIRTFRTKLLQQAVRIAVDQQHHAGLFALHDLPESLAAGVVKPLGNFVENHELRLARHPVFSGQGRGPLAVTVERVAASAIAVASSLATQA